MIEILFNCFDSLNFYFILIIGFLLYLINKKSRDEFNKKQIEDSIESIERRSEECPQQYPNGWLPVYDSHDLKKGEVKPIFALDRDLVIYRGSSGRVYAFDAYCPHLGANLGVGGSVLGDDIKCHFHGWQFNNQGHCKHIPGLDDKSIPKTGIKKWRCVDVNDYIYVWHHSEEKEPDWFIPKLDKLENLKYKGKSIRQFNCHIQDIVENQSDGRHFELLHTTENTIPYFMRKLINFKINYGFWKALDAPNSHQSLSEFTVNLNLGSLALPPTTSLITQFGPCYFTIEIDLGAGSYIKFIANSNLVTVGYMRQLVVIKLYYKPTLLGHLLAPLILPVIDIFNYPDLEVLNMKRFVRKPTFTELDDMIIKFRRWFKQFY